MENKLYKSIYQRKSCRKYHMQPLSQEKIDEIDEKISTFDTLYPDVSLSHRFIQKGKGIFHVQAPHYLIIEGKGEKGELEAAGFLYEQLVLWFNTVSVGCVWLGMTKDPDSKQKGNDIITIGFGIAAESNRREVSEFKRKPIAEITNAPTDVCIEAARLAPSGVNIQPWYFEKQGEEIFLYQKKLGLPLSLAYKLSDLDMGIALCHYALACEEKGFAFSFTRDNSLPVKSGYNSFGIIR